MFETAPAPSSVPTLLVTGASGFVGRRLVEVLGTAAATLSTRTDPAGWAEALAHKHCVVHLAARVHVMQDAAADPLLVYRQVNVEGTLELARQAAACGVKRFVFISSVKVNGEETQPGHAFRADDLPAPRDAYGVSKMEAEAGLRRIAEQTGLELVIIRPPLVYGPGVAANFASMVRWLQRGIPLPLGAIDNRRSLVARDNLVDLIKVCTQHPAAANHTFLVSDGDDVSTTELLRRMAAALGKPARLLPVPPALLAGCAALMGKQAVAQRLLSSLQVDIRATRELLGWTPPLSLKEGLRQVAQHLAHTP